jgi:hypothetical protein
MPTNAVATYRRACAVLGIKLPFAIALPQLATLPMEYLTGQAVTAFSTTQLPERRAAAALIVDVRQDVSDRRNAPTFFT